MIQKLFSNLDLQKDIDEFLEAKAEETILVFSSVGIDIVNDAKKKGTYKDFSSNLRSSVGFKIFYQGSNVYDLFSGKNSEGIEIGKSVAEQNKKGKDVQLVVTAGMEYAQKVEKRHEGGVLNNFIDLPKIEKEIKQLLE